MLQKLRLWEKIFAGRRRVAFASSCLHLRLSILSRIIWKRGHTGVLTSEAAVEAVEAKFKIKTIFQTSWDWMTTSTISGMWVKEIIVQSDSINLFTFKFLVKRSIWKLTIYEQKVGEREKWEIYCFRVRCVHFFSIRKCRNSMHKTIL